MKDFAVDFLASIDDQRGCVNFRHADFPALIPQNYAAFFTGCLIFGGDFLLEKK